MKSNIDCSLKAFIKAMLLLSLFLPSYVHSLKLMGALPAFQGGSNFSTGNSGNSGQFQINPQSYLNNNVVNLGQQSSDYKSDDK